MYSYGNFSAFFLWSPLGNYEQKSCLNKLKFWEASQIQKRSICWKFKLSISLGTQKSAKTPPSCGQDDQTLSAWFFILRWMKKGHKSSRAKNPSTRTMAQASLVRTHHYDICDKLFNWKIHFLSRLYPNVHYQMSALIHGLDCVFWYVLNFFAYGHAYLHIWWTIWTGYFVNCTISCFISKEFSFSVWRCQFQNYSKAIHVIPKYKSLLSGKFSLDSRNLFNNLKYKLRPMI